MTVAAAARLEEIASRDASLAPLARLQAEGLRALDAEPAWRAAAAALDIGRVPTDRPLLHGTEIRLARGPAGDLLERLLRMSGEDPSGADEIDPLALVEASVTQREVETEALAAIARVEPAALMAIGQVLSWPLLIAVGERARDVLGGLAWTRGHCPVCAAWPLLAELRGLDRERILRCGRCATSWKFRHGECPFCGNDDHRTLTYLAPEDQRESRRASVCDRCHGYVKGLATLRTFDAEGLALADLGSVELDLAAMERGYGRPPGPAVPLDVTVRPLDDR